MATEIAICYLKKSALSQHYWQHSYPMENMAASSPLSSRTTKEHISITFGYILPNYCQKLFCLTHEKAAIPLSSGIETLIYNVQPKYLLKKPKFLLFCTGLLLLTILSLETQNQKHNLYNLIYSQAMHRTSSKRNWWGFYLELPPRRHCSCWSCKSSHEENTNAKLEDFCEHKK